MNSMTRPDSVRVRQTCLHGSDLDSLIEQLSAATEPSRELDEAIGCHLGDVPDTTSPWGWMPVAPAIFIALDDEDPSCIRRLEIERYTSSLDTVMPLLPERCTYTLFGRQHGRCSAVVEERDGKRWSGNGATAAMALAVAVLKAMRGEV